MRRLSSERREDGYIRCRFLSLGPRVDVGTRNLINLSPGTAHRKQTPTICMQALTEHLKPQTKIPHSTIYLLVLAPSSGFERSLQKSRRLFGVSYFMVHHPQIPQRHS